MRPSQAEEAILGEANMAGFPLDCRGVFAEANPVRAFRSSLRRLSSPPDRESDFYVRSALPLGDTQREARPFL